jgi:hypothetical protein
VLEQRFVSNPSVNQPRMQCAANRNLAFSVIHAVIALPESIRAIQF